MAVWVSSGALLLVMLTGASYSYPAPQGFDPSYSHSSGYDANHASAGSNWEVPSGGLAPRASASRAASKTVSNPARPLKTASHKEPSYSQPASTQDIHWAVPPPRRFSGEETSVRPSESWFVAPEPPGLVPSEFQAGELSQLENTYEHGDYEFETEEQGFLPPPLGYQPSPLYVQPLDEEDFTSELQPSGLGRSWAQNEYPYDYMFLTGKYPPGTVTHSSSSFEQGVDYWHDIHYIRDYFPTDPSAPQVVIDFEAPQHVEQPSQPVKQTHDSTSYGWSGAATGQNQPYGAVDLQGSYFQPGEQPHQGHPAGGYGLSKVGY